MEPHWADLPPFLPVSAGFAKTSLDQGESRTESMD